MTAIGNFIMPISFILYGLFYLKKSKSTINNYTGYRTQMTMLSEQTWQYGNKRAGEVWIKLGLGLILFTIGYLYIVKKSFTELSWFLLIVSMVGSVVSLQKVDKELRAKFDKEGNLKK